MSDAPELDKMTAALRDAERYRWLRAVHVECGKKSHICGPGHLVFRDDGGHEVMPTHADEFDAAIDRSMTLTPTENKP